MDEESTGKPKQKQAFVGAGVLFILFFISSFICYYFEADNNTKYEAIFLAEIINYEFKN